MSCSEPVPCSATNQALITTLIPGGNDPCNPNREGAQILLDAATRAAPAVVLQVSRTIARLDRSVAITVKVVGRNSATHIGGGGDADTLPSTGDSGSVQPVLLEPVVAGVSPLRA